jgi:ammonia channel protein AmtB
MILHKATIAGGVAIGASAQIIYIPAVALGIGIIAGVTAFFSLRHLQGRF